MAGATALEPLPETAAAERLSALCHAFVDYGVTHPGHYRVLFGTAGTPGWEPTEGRLPGLPTMDLLVGAVAAAGAPYPAATAQCLWAGMHGLITLRQDRPSFPWLPLDRLVDALVAAHLATAR
ncbi:TetR-like C-terminal domain-containing protein [Nocardia sp. NPDC056611]|uniref:TetR-like C-terminal domain-containing protein n=1 Tax=Nocardia sp. NPDC056611 TaxID=3345877 RepID=UPI00366CCC27